MPRKLGIAQVSDYDRFVAFCASEFDRRPDDPALRYFDNRFFNRRADNQTGHLRQAFYAAREFYRRHPRLRTIPPALMDDEGRLRMTDWPGINSWRRFVSRHRNIRLPDGASMETIYKILPVSLGGVVAGGGGASPSVKVILPLVTKYLGILDNGGHRIITGRPLGADHWDEFNSDDKSSTRRSRFITSRIIRDSRKSSDLKEMYEHECQVCKRRIEIRCDDYYSEAHHLQPLGGRHHGPDSKPNILVLCPWHHAEFDHFLWQINPKSMVLKHRTRVPHESEKKLYLAGGHQIGEEFILYNNIYFEKLAG